MFRTRAELERIAEKNARNWELAKRNWSIAGKTLVVLMLCLSWFAMYHWGHVVGYAEGLAR